MRSIIHFTREYKTLLNILTEKSFKLKYCREVFYLADRITSNAVHPMVSFSEQFISRIDKKNITYGRFGIGLKKSWVDRKKIHPVLYLDRNSYVANALSDLLKARRKKAETVLAPIVKLSIMTIKCFTKNAVGFNSYFNMNDFNFKAENEWRYVPKKSDIGNNLISTTKRKYDEDPDYYNRKLEKYKLGFRRSDIEWVFVETQQQRNEISEAFGIDKKIIKISGWSTDLKKAKFSN